MGGAQGYLKGRGEAACPRESNVAEGRWARLCLLDAAECRMPLHLG